MTPGKKRVAKAISCGGLILTLGFLYFQTKIELDGIASQYHKMKYKDFDRYEDTLINALEQAEKDQKEQVNERKQAWREYNYFILHEKDTVIITRFDDQEYVNNEFSMIDPRHQPKPDTSEFVLAYNSYDTLRALESGDDFGHFQKEGLILTRPGFDSTNSLTFDTVTQIENYKIKLTPFGH
jgi:hypothetical protein